MVASRHVVAVFSAVVGAAVLCGAAIGETYRDDALGWSVDLPAGWHAATPQEVQQLDENTGRMFKGAKPFTYVAVFSKTKAATLTPPYVIMQFTPTDFSKASREDIERTLQAAGERELKAHAQDKATSAASDAIKDATFGTALLDAENRIHMTINIKGPPAVTCQQVGLIAKSGLVQMNWYDHTAKPAGTIAEHQAMLASFRLDADRAWTPGPGVGGGLGGAVSGGVVGAGIGALVGLIFAIGRKFVKKPNTGNA